MGHWMENLEYNESNYIFSLQGGKHKRKQKLYIAEVEYASPPSDSVVQRADSLVPSVPQWKKQVL